MARSRLKVSRVAQRVRPLRPPAVGRARRGWDWWMSRGWSLLPIKGIVIASARSSLLRPDPAPDVAALSSEPLRRHCARPQPMSLHRVRPRRRHPAGGRRESASSTTAAKTLHRGDSMLDVL